MKKHIWTFVLCVFLLWLTSCGFWWDKKEVPASSTSQNTEVPKWWENEDKKEFVWITTSDGKVEDLFALQWVDADTSWIVKAATEFVASLDADTKSKVMYEIDSDEWMAWSNIDARAYKRAGLNLREMTDEQKNLANTLLQESLSAKGYELARNIMKTDTTLAELNSNTEKFGEDLYYFTIMGEPSETKPWGWQLDGHHLVINYFVLENQVVMTPVFMWGEPIITKAGVHAGNEILQDEQNIALAFMDGLTDEFKKKAMIELSSKRGRIQAWANSDNMILDYEGLNIWELEEEGQEAFLNLIHQYIGNMKEDQSVVKMSEIAKHIDQTYFAWNGDISDKGVFYYRIHSPVILIEFDHQAPVWIPGADKKITKDHIHTMVRTPNNGDYGKSLLQQHIAEAHQNDTEQLPE